MYANTVGICIFIKFIVLAKRYNTPLGCNLSSYIILVWQNIVYHFISKIAILKSAPRLEGCRFTIDMLQLAIKNK